MDWMSKARYNHLDRAEATYTSYGYNHPYKVWYRFITRLFMTPHGSSWDSGNYNVFLFIILFFSN